MRLKAPTSRTSFRLLEGGAFESGEGAVVAGGLHFEQAEFDPDFGVLGSTLGGFFEVPGGVGVLAVLGERFADGEVAQGRARAEGVERGEFGLDTGCVERERARRGFQCAGFEEIGEAGESGGEGFGDALGVALADADASGQHVGEGRDAGGGVG